MLKQKMNRLVSFWPSIEKFLLIGSVDYRTQLKEGASFSHTTKPGWTQAVELEGTVAASNTIEFTHLDENGVEQHHQVSLARGANKDVFMPGDQVLFDLVVDPNTLVTSATNVKISKLGPVGERKTGEITEFTKNPGFGTIRCNDVSIQDKIFFEAKEIISFEGDLFPSVGSKVEFSLRVVHLNKGLSSRRVQAVRIRSLETRVRGIICSHVKHIGLNFVRIGRTVLFSRGDLPVTVGSEVEFTRQVDQPIVKDLVVLCSQEKPRPPTISQQLSTRGYVTKKCSRLGDVGEITLDSTDNNNNSPPRRITFSVADVRDYPLWPGDPIKFKICNHPNGMAHLTEIRLAGKFPRKTGLLLEVHPHTCGFVQTLQDSEPIHVDFSGLPKECLKPGLKLNFKLVGPTPIAEDGKPVPTTKKKETARLRRRKAQAMNNRKNKLRKK